VPSVHLADAVQVYSSTKNGVADVEGNIYAEALTVEVEVKNVGFERIEHWDRIHKTEQEQQNLYVAEDNGVGADAQVRVKSTWQRQNTGEKAYTVEQQEVHYFQADSTQLSAIHEGSHQEDIAPPVGTVGVEDEEQMRLVEVVQPAILRAQNARET